MTSNLYYKTKQSVHLPARNHFGGHVHKSLENCFGVASLSMTMSLRWIYAYLPILVFRFSKKSNSSLWNCPLGWMWVITAIHICAITCAGSLGVWYSEHIGTCPSKFPMCIRTAEGIFVEGILYNSKQFNRNVIRLGKLQSVSPFRVQIMFQIKG